ncbi:MAG: S8 family serine peptidase [Pseudomonadota bacterium]
MHSLTPDRPHPLHAVLAAAMLALTGCGGGGGDSTAASTGYTLSGSIQAAAGNAVDSDVNDPFAPYASNDSVAAAQVIPNPVVVGGYLNQPGGGPDGRSRSSGDISDFYRISMATNQLVILNIADHVAGDLDLFLYDEGNTLVDSSEGIGPTETVTAPLAGTYYLEVRIYARATPGASSYTLTLGQQLSAAQSGASFPADDFVPGEIIARFKPGSSAGKSAAVQAAASGLAYKAGTTGRALLLTLPRPAGSNAAGSATERRQYQRETIQAIKRLRQRPDVEFAEPNYLRRVTLAPGDTNYPLQWHYPLINLPQAWDITTGTDTVVVAVIDTGILTAHPDLQGRIGPGYDFISDPTNALDGDGIDPDPEDPGDGGVAGNSSFHGTHVAGTIAAATDNSIGVAGTSWATTLMPLRTLGLNGGTSYDIMQALLYAAGLPNDSGGVPVQRADIVNLSLGGYSFSQSEQNVIDQVRGQGVMIVAAAGNDATSSLFYPASYNGVLSVSAVDINQQAAPYSNFGAAIDLAAPGGNTAADVNGDGYPDGVLSTSGDDSSGSPPQYLYRFLQGTSMATPHVAGTLALMKAVTPTLTPADIDNLLLNGQLTTDLGTPGRDNVFGYGLIDAHRAVAAAQGGITPVPPTLVVSPSALNFSTLGTTAFISVANGGGGTLTVNPPTDDAGWLNVVPAVTDPVTGTGSYVVSVSRNRLAEGTYTATITISSSANSIQVPVIMQVTLLNQDADAGYHYILLIDQASGVPKYQASAAAANGVYQYTLNGVAAGTYELLAGTDLDNDGIICVGSEACGGYISLDQLTPVTVAADRTGLDFNSGFNVVITTAGQASATAGVARPSLERATP